MFIDKRLRKKSRQALHWQQRFIVLAVILYNSFQIIVDGNRNRPEVENVSRKVIEIGLCCDSCLRTLYDKERAGERLGEGLYEHQERDRGLRRE